MVSIDTSPEVPMQDLLVIETPGELRVAETSASNEEKPPNPASGGNKELRNISNLEEDASYKNDFKNDNEDTFISLERTEISLMEVGENGIEEVRHINTEIETPSLLEYSTENSSIEGSYIGSGSSEADTNENQRNSEGLEQDFITQRQLTRKRFQAIIKLARKTLIEARVAAQEESVAKRYEVATQKKRELQKRRAEKRRGMLAHHARPAQSKGLVSPMLEKVGRVAWDKEEMKEVRKIHAELDRAKAKKAQASTKRESNVSFADTTLLQLRNKSSETEKYEVERLIKELHSLNLTEKASTLAYAFNYKMETERELQLQLKRERRQVMLETKRQKLEEVARLRAEEKRRRIEEKAREERERREREERERKKKIEEDRRRREHNVQMWTSYHMSELACSFSRSFTYSYFPKLDTHPGHPNEGETTSKYARICAMRLKSNKEPTKSRKATNKL